MPSDDKSADHRRINKPIMEKRRRARINDSLTQLKSLVLEGMKKDPARHSKLEKADILEMAVKHLRSLQARPERALSRYRDGYVECRREVVAYLGRDQALDGAVKQRLLTHLRSAVEPAALGAGLASLQLLPGSLPAGQIAFIVPGVVATAAAAAAAHDVHTMLPLSVATQPASVGSPSPVPSSHTEHTWDPAEPSSPASPSSSVGSSGSSGSSDSAPPDSPRPLDLVAHSRSLDDACWRPW